MKSPILMGKIWVLLGEKGRLIEDIDTDQIFHNAFLHITELRQMGQYALGNLGGWKDFPGKTGPGDIIITGRNFGAGSSRQQAVDCFKSLQTGIIIAPSFGAIYFRNAVNSGFPVMKCSKLVDLIASGLLKTGDEIRVNIRTGEGQNLYRKEALFLEPMNEVQYNLWEAEGLFSYAKKMKQD